MAGLVPATGSAPGHRRHRAARSPVRQTAGQHRTIAGQRRPQARRHLKLVRLAGPARAYHRQPRRRHRPASPRPAHPRRPGPHPGPGPRAHPRGRHRARPAARPHRGTDRRPAVHRCPPQRGNWCRRRRPRHQRRAPGAPGHPRRRPATRPATARPGRVPDRRLPRLPGRRGRRSSAIRDQDRQAAIRRRRTPDPAPPRHPGRAARRPGSPPGTADDPPVLYHAVSSGRGVRRPPQQYAACRLMHHPAIRAGPGSRSTTMAPRQASLPRPPPSTRPQADPAALITPAPQRDQQADECRRAALPSRRAGKHLGQLLCACGKRKLSHLGEAGT
jgi:hypothetical protein